jgi:hypothetical protein
VYILEAFKAALYEVFMRVIGIWKFRGHSDEAETGVVLGLFLDE